MSIYIFFGREHLLDLFLGCGFAYYFTLFPICFQVIAILSCIKNLFLNLLCSPSFLFFLFFYFFNFKIFNSYMLLVKSLTRDLQTIIQSDISQKEKTEYCILTLTCGI